MPRALCAPERAIARDRCPGAVALHDAEDGSLARIRVPGGRLAAGQLEALAAAARLGNGLVDITSRANVQVRGLAGGVGEELAALLAGAGLLPSLDHDRVRNILASPVTGRHPRSRLDTDVVVTEIDRGLCADPALAALPGRFLFAVDDGSGLALDHVADVALVADDAIFALALDGRVTGLRVAPADAAAVALAAARAFLAERDARGSRAWRIGELADGAAIVAARIDTEIGSEIAVSPAPALTPGRLMQRDERIAVTALTPLGRLDAAALAGLAELAAECAGEVRLSTHRTVTVPDVETARAGEVEAALERLGLVLAADSGWRGLTACAGLGACPKALIDVRAAAARRVAGRVAGSGAEHWTACERRCGERADQPISVVALAGGGVLLRIGSKRRTVAGVDEALAVLE
jgi:precorrin-3B synthase